MGRHAAKSLESNLCCLHDCHDCNLFTDGFVAWAISQKQILYKISGCQGTLLNISVNTSPQDSHAKTLVRYPGDVKVQWITILMLRLRLHCKTLALHPLKTTCESGWWCWLIVSKGLRLKPTLAAWGLEAFVCGKLFKKLNYLEPQNTVIFNHIWPDILKVVYFETTGQYQVDSVGGGDTWWS